MDQTERRAASAATDDRGSLARAAGKQLCRQLLRNQDPRDALATLSAALGELLHHIDCGGLDTAGHAEAVALLAAIQELLADRAAQRDCIH